jgi:hypothetical protein
LLSFLCRNCRRTTKPCFMALQSMYKVSIFKVERTFDFKI